MFVNVQDIHSILVQSILLTSWFSWMKAQLIATQPIVVMPGQLVLACSKKGLLCSWAMVCILCFDLLFISLIVKVIRYSILPALLLDGILTVDVVEGSFNARQFARFVDGLLNQMNPYPGNNSVIIMDNCRILKYPEVLDMILDWYVYYILFLLSADQQYFVVACDMNFYPLIPWISTQLSWRSLQSKHIYNVMVI